MRRENSMVEDRYVRYGYFKAACCLNRFTKHFLYNRFKNKIVAYCSMFVTRDATPTVATERETPNTYTYTTRTTVPVKSATTRGL